MPLPTLFLAGYNNYPDEYENKTNKVVKGKYFNHSVNV